MKRINRFNLTVLAVFTILLTSILINGCATRLDPAGPYQGDTLLYWADKTTVTAYDGLHSLVTIEYQNRTNFPGAALHKYADFVRQNAPNWFAAEWKARAAYVAATNDPAAAQAFTVAVAVIGDQLTNSATVIHAVLPNLKFP